MTQQLVPGRITRPSVSIDDPAFPRMAWYKTDLSKTFAKARAQLPRAKEKPCST